MGSSKGAGGATSTFDYYGMACALVGCGPASGLWAIIIDGIQVWPVDAKGLPLTQVYRPADGVDANGFSLLNIPNYGAIRFYWGTGTQNADAGLNSNDGAELHPAYRGWVYVVLDNFLLGRERQATPNLEVIYERAPMVLNSAGTGTQPDPLADGQANPLAVAQEALLDARFGFDLLPAELAFADWSGALATVAGDKRNLVSVLVDSQVSARELVSDLGDYGECRVIAAGRKFGAVAWAREGQGSNIGALPVLAADQLCAPVKLTRGLPASLPNQWALVYDDRGRRYFRDGVRTALLDVRSNPGGLRATSIDRPWITIRSQAQAWLDSFVTRRGRPRRSASLSVRRGFAEAFRAGDLFWLDVEVEPGGTELLAVMRIDRLNRPAGNKPAVIDCTEELSFAPILVSFPAGTDASLPGYPVPLKWTRALEAPPVLAEFNTQRLTSLAMRQDQTTLGHGFYVRPAGGEAVLLGWQRQVAIRGVLSAAVGLSDTTFNVTFTRDYPGVAADELELLQTSPGDISAGNNDLLAVLVQCKTVDVGELDSDAVGQCVEYCSISATAAQSLISDPTGTWTLSVLRARLGWPGRAFTLLPQTEVWIVRRTELAVWQHQRVASSGRAMLLDAGDPVEWRAVPFNAFIASDKLNTTTTEVDYPGPGWRSFTFGAQPYLPFVTFLSPTPADLTQITINQAQSWHVQVNDTDGNMVRLQVVLINNDGTRFNVDNSDLASLAFVDAKGIFTPTQEGICRLSVTASDLTGNVVEASRSYVIKGTGVSPPIIGPVSSFYRFKSHFTLALSDVAAGGTLEYATSTPGGTPSSYQTYSAPVAMDIPLTVYGRTRLSGVLSPVVTRTYYPSNGGGYNLP